MKKAATIGAALLGLLFLGATTWSQDPDKAKPTLRLSAELLDTLRAGLAQGPVGIAGAPQDALPTFREVLRGKVGQECSALTNDRVHWTLRYGPRHGGATLAAVGDDFVQIRYEDGREQYLPFQRIHVVDTRNHGITNLDSRDVMRFLGRNLVHSYKGEVITSFKHRPEGTCRRLVADAPPVWSTPMGSGTAPSWPYGAPGSLVRLLSRNRL